MIELKYGRINRIWHPEWRKLGKTGDFKPTQHHVVLWWICRYSRWASNISYLHCHTAFIEYRWMGKELELIDYACLSSFQDTLKVLSRIGHVQVLINFGLGSRIWIDWLLLCGYLISMPAVKELMEKVIHIRKDIIHRMMLQWLRSPTLGQIVYHWQCENIMI
mgnify:CR=1 FL=1